MDAPRFEIQSLSREYGRVTLVLHLYAKLGGLGLLDIVLALSRGPAQHKRLSAPRHCGRRARHRVCLVEVRDREAKRGTKDARVATASRKLLKAELRHIGT